MSSKYLWRLGESPPDIDPHSVAKHNVLARYLRRYVAVVTANRRMDSLRMTLVDGFAGGGEYKSPATGALHPGSPLIMLRAMDDAAGDLASQHRGKPLHLDLRYIFVEKDSETRQYLAGVLAAAGYKRRLGEDINLVQGSFEENVDEILNQIRARGPAGRSIFILDQYGYTGVLMATIRKIFATLKRAEVVLTLATDWLVDFLADSPGHAKALAPLEMDPTSLLTAKKDSRDWRRVIQHRMYEHIVKECGARYFTPFFIVSPDAHRSYWLLHLSGHARARDEMAKLHWEMHNHFEHYGGAGLRMLGYNPGRDPAVTGQVPFAFDLSARRSTLTALSEDLPNRVWPYADGVRFGDLFAAIANETPAHSDIVKESVLSLAQAGHFEIRGAGGGPVRSLDRLEYKHLIVPRRQTRMEFRPPIVAR